MTAEVLEPPCFSLTLPVRWSDLDALGHVYHANYLTFLEEARDAWLARDLGLSGADYVIAQLGIRYVSEIVPADSPIQVELRVASVGRSSIVLDERVVSAGGARSAHAEVVIVLWDRERRSSRQLSAGERDRCELLVGVDGGT
jgi:acyl-CoA thioester hydrolase